MHTAPIDGELLRNARDGRRLLSLIIQAQLQKIAPRWKFYPQSLQLRFAGGLAWTAPAGVVVVWESDDNGVTIRVTEQYNEENFIVLRKLPCDHEDIYVIKEKGRCLRVVA